MKMNRTVIFEESDIPKLRAVRRMLGTLNGIDKEKAGLTKEQSLFVTEFYDDIFSIETDEEQEEF